MGWFSKPSDKAPKIGLFRYSGQVLPPAMLGIGWFRVAISTTPDDFEDLSKGDGSAVAPGGFFWRLGASPPHGQLQWLAFQCAIFLTIASRLDPRADATSLSAIESGMHAEAAKSLAPTAADDFNVALTLYRCTLNRDLTDHTTDAPPRRIPKQTCDELLRWMLEFYGKSETFSALGELQLTDRDRLLFNTHVTATVDSLFQSARNQGLAYQGER